MSFVFSLIKTACLDKKRKVSWNEKGRRHLNTHNSGLAGCGKMGFEEVVNKGNVLEKIRGECLHSETLKDV